MTVPEPDWRQRVFGALGAVVVVGLVIGGVLGAVAYSTARVTGLAGADASAAIDAEGDSVGTPVAAEVPASSSPSAEPADDAGEDAGDDTGQEAAPKAGARKHKTDKPRAGHKHRSDKRRHDRSRHDRKKHARAGRRAQVTLVASQHRVRRMGRINLSGRYPGHGGARLVVQRFERGHWARFPVTATVRGGRFRTWVASGHRGVNRFRVVAVNSGRASDPVTVRVR